MKWLIQAVGKPSLEYAKRGIAEYEKRLKRMVSVQVDYFGRDQGRDSNSALHLQRSEGSFRIVLDERGELWTTEKFVKLINQWEMSGTKRMSLLIGGADGHSEGLRDEADAVWALSPLTLQHELALLVLFEQVYRAYSIKRGEPYHR